MLGGVLVLGGLLGLVASLRLNESSRRHESRLRESSAVLTATLAALQRTTNDWAHWDDLYRFMQYENPRFVEANLATTSLFDEGGVMLLFRPGGQRLLSYGQGGRDLSSHGPLADCVRPYLSGLVSLASNLHLVCRGGDGALYLGVASPISDSIGQAPSRGALVLLEPMVKANYGQAFNDPMLWLMRRMRMTQLVQGPPPSGSAAPIASAAEAIEPLALARPLHAASGNPVVVLQEPWPPGLTSELLWDLLLGLGLLAALAGVRAGVLVERRSQRLLLRRAEQGSNRRIRRTGQELERLLDRMGPGGTGPARAEAALGRLLESGVLPPGEPKPFGGLPIEAKLTWLADGLQQFLERARSLALLDPLTQLPNRRFFIEQVQVQLAGCEQRGERFAILFVDVDKFKEINDAYGHALGDAALVLVAETLQSLTEDRDFLGRYGGDEFAILRDLNSAAIQDDAAIKADLLAYATRLLAPFESKVDLEGIAVEISVSVGISLLDSRSSDLKTAMRRSDIAMYRAKQNPGGRVAIFDPDDDATDLDDYRLYGDLMQALRDSSFEIVFQPIVDRHGSVVAVEALARWCHPRLGQVSPELFLDLAERYRQTYSIAYALLALTLRNFQSLHLEHPQIRLALNLSPSKLGDPLLVEKLDELLANHEIPADLITIELTERSVLHPNPLVSANLAKLREKGMAISLDDFGTGFSSLSLLNTLRPDEVKIDKGFVMAMHQDPYALEIVNLVAAMAPRMNLKVVAEGVENGAVLERLQHLEIAYFQGFHFSLPLPAAQLRRSALWSNSAPRPSGSAAIGEDGLDRFPPSPSMSQVPGTSPAAATHGHGTDGGADPAAPLPNPADHPHNFEAQKEVHRQIRNDADYDDWEYGTEPLPQEAWSPKKSQPSH